MKKLFIGIDFAKEKFDAAIIDAIGLKEFGDRQFGTFSNDKKGFRQFIKWVKGFAGSATESEWLFCGEDTGQCSQGLSKWLYGRGLDIWIESPYAIKHSSGIQRLKTDKADASMIAEYDYYDRLIKRGKHKSVALNNVKNKLLRIIVALVRDRTVYDPRTFKHYQERWKEKNQATCAL